MIVRYVAIQDTIAADQVVAVAGTREYYVGQ
jgi:hypothetical protein